MLQDTLVLSSVDNGKLDGSAVHVVESCPPVSSSSSTQSRLLNGESRQSRDFARRSRSERSAAARENFLASRVVRMEELLSSLNGSITAMENGTAPETSGQYAQNETSSFPSTGAPLLVRDLAGFVGQMADGIERFPARLREVQSFLAEDQPLPNRWVLSYRLYDIAVIPQQTYISHFFIIVATNKGLFSF